MLDEFGKLVISEVIDNQYSFIKNDLKDLKVTEGYKELFRGMTLEQKSQIENYTREVLIGAVFDFLRIFEENEEYRITGVGNDEVPVNLAEVSDMLKSEHIGKNGWIARFSEYSEDFKNSF